MPHASQLFISLHQFSFPRQGSSQMVATLHASDVWCIMSWRVLQEAQARGQQRIGDGLGVWGDVEAGQPSALRAQPGPAATSTAGSKGVGG